MRALDDLVRAGKLLYVGISDAPAWVVAQANTLADWRGWTPFIGLQVRYSLTEREIERELLPMADAFGLSVAAWSPLAGGVLSGKFTRSHVSEPTRVGASDISERDLQIAREVDAVADELGVSSSQVAIAWTMAHHQSLHPLLGAKRLDQLLDNLAAVDIVLPEPALARLDDVSAITRGFPADFIDSSRDFVYGPVLERLAGNT
jgi:aryl-alcohol dehydrogenase-like predicted oxidoreductase